MTNVNRRRTLASVRESRYRTGRCLRQKDRGIAMEIADLRKLRREVAETWPEDTSREMALQVLDALVCKLSQATTEK